MNITDKSQVFYRNGQPARILATDLPGREPIASANQQGKVNTHDRNGLVNPPFANEAWDLIEIPEAGGGDWADAAAKEIGKDISGRRDWKHVWNTTDADVIEQEIIPAWKEIIRKHAPEPQRAEEPKPPDAREWWLLIDALTQDVRLTLKEKPSFHREDWELVRVREVRPEPLLAKGQQQIAASSGNVPGDPNAVGASASLATPAERVVRHPGETGTPTPLPEGVPALEGEFADFEFFGLGPLKVQANSDSDDIACLQTTGRWLTGLTGKSANYYAIRRGTELHRLNFGGLEAAGNAASEGAGAFRWFLYQGVDSRWRMHPDGTCEIASIDREDWSDSICSRESFLEEDGRLTDGTIETDASGQPLKGVRGN